MASTKTLRVAPDSELSALLRDALETGGPVVVDTGEAVYRLGIESGESDEASRLRWVRTPDEIEDSIDGIREAIGSWRGNVDAEAFKAYIRERRLSTTTALGQVVIGGRSGSVVPGPAVCAASATNEAGRRVARPAAPARAAGDVLPAR